jgi:hypothetical protein
VITAFVTLAVIAMFAAGLLCALEILRCEQTPDHARPNDSIGDTK